MKENNPKYISPFDREYLSYNDHLVAFSRKIQEKISKDLPKVFSGFKENVAIALTGSDARLEKGPVSLIEIILFGENHPNLSKACKKLIPYISENRGKDVFQRDIEFKNIEKDKMYETKVSDCHDYKIKFISPNRFFDARPLFKKGRIYQQARKKFVNEMVSDEGTQILKKIKQRTKEHGRISVSGAQKYKGEELTHYSFEDCISFYDPKKDIWSFKQGPLRTVQYALVRDSIKKIRTGVNPEEIFSLPKNTIEKLNRIEVEEMSPLSTMQMGDLSDCYKYFLHLYHISQSNYENKLNKETMFDGKEARERAKSIEDLCKLQIIS